MATKIQFLAPARESTGLDVLVLLAAPGADDGQLQGEALHKLNESLGGSLLSHLAQVKYKAERNLSLALPLLGSKLAQHLVIVGLGKLGEKLPGSVLAEALAVGVRASLSFKPSKVEVQVDDSWVKASDAFICGLGGAGAVGLGVALGAYRFDRYFTATKDKNTLTELRVVTPSAKEGKAAFDLGLSMADGVCLARDLVNEPPNELFPETFAKMAKKVADENKLKFSMLDEKGLEKAGMRLHLAVGQGSAHPPRFVHLTYSPKVKKGKVAFVGKGLTFDSGGLCIKPMMP